MERLIPHALSALRLVLAYPFFLAMGDETAIVALGAGLLFATAVVTDVLDGRMARRLGTASAWGRGLDHTADFAFVVLGLLGASLRGALTPWLPIVVAAAFIQYVGDSFLFRAKQGLRMSWLGLGIRKSASSFRRFIFFPKPRRWRMWSYPSSTALDRTFRVSVLAHSSKWV